MEEKRILAAGMVLFRREGDQKEVLLLRNRQRREWGFPKGHLDGGESLEEAAFRELQEETGLQHQQIRLFPLKTVVSYRAEGGQKEVHYYLAELVEKAAVQLSEEHDQFLWVAPEKVEKYIPHQNLQQAFRELWQKWQQENSEKS